MGATLYIAFTLLGLSGNLKVIWSTWDGVFRLSANIALFYIRDLSIHEFSYALRSWNQILEDTEDNCNIFVKIDPRGKSISRYAGHGSTHLLNLAFTFKE